MQHEASKSPSNPFRPQKISFWRSEGLPVQSIVAAQRALHIAAGLLFLEGSPFIVEFFTSGQTKLNLGNAALVEINADILI